MSSDIRGELEVDSQVYFKTITVTLDEERVRGSRNIPRGQNLTSMWNWKRGFLFKTKETEYKD